MSVIIWEMEFNACLVFDSSSKLQEASYERSDDTESEMSPEWKI